MQDAPNRIKSPIDGDLIRGVCPIDLLALEPVPISKEEDVSSIVHTARSAQEGWSRLSLSERKKALEAAAQQMLSRRGQIIDLVRLELGKMDADALFSEGLGPVDAFRSWSRVVESALKTNSVRLNPLAFPRKRASVSWLPRGVIGTIAPWNFPVAGLYRSAFPALLSGNGWVVKPSEYAPRSSAWFVEQLADHLPRGLAQVVQGGANIGKHLITEVDAVVFTGSTRTGRLVTTQCAELGRPVSAEMGGNDAAIVLADAHRARTTAGLTQWALQNSGQSCGAIEIAYIEESAAELFVPRLTDAWSQIQVAPLANQLQLERIETHVQDAIAKGAQLLCGGRRTGDGLGYLPTLLDHCTEQMELVKEETFGPVLAICRIEGPTEAIRRINRGQYGLTASIWTEDIERAERLAQRIEVGVVTINNHGLTGAMVELPWSGTKNSGYSIANSKWALSTFARPQTLLVDHAKAPESYWLPYDVSAWALGDLLADLQQIQVERSWRLPLLLRERSQSLKRFFRWSA